MNHLAISIKSNRYLFILMVFLFTSSLLDAQIVEQTLTDTIFATQQIQYDLNNDSEVDYTFEIITLSPGLFAARAIPQGSNRILDNSTFGYADALNLGAPVNGNFVTNSVVLGTSVGGGGLFSGVGEKYLGLQLNTVTGTFYGWILLNCSSNNDTLIVLGFGYNSQEQQQITAGQNSVVGIIKAKNYSNATLLFTAGNILVIGKELSYTYQVIDLKGAVVLSGIAVDNKIENVQLASGFYTIQLSSNEGSFFTKLVVNP